MYMIWDIVDTLCFQWFDIYDFQLSTQKTSKSDDDVSSQTYQPFKRGWGHQSNGPRSATRCAVMIARQEPRHRPCWSWTWQAKMPTPYNRSCAFLFWGGASEQHPKRCRTERFFPSNVSASSPLFNGWRANKGEINTIFRWHLTQKIIHAEMWHVYCTGHCNYYGPTWLDY